MQRIFILLIPIISGVSLGGLTTYFSMTRLEPHFELLEKQGEEPSDFRGKAGRVSVVNGTTHDFGTMEKNTEKEHIFIFKNIGDAPLKLSVGKTTCKCTLSQLADEFLQPNDITEVTLSWKPNSYAVSFSQQAEIETNDPATPVVFLSVSGRVIQKLRPVPETLTFHKVSANETAQQEIDLFAYGAETFEILSHQWQEPEYAEFYDLKINEMPAEVLSEEDGATAGKRLTVQIRPGLPLGPIYQKLKLKTDVADAEEMEIPFLGSVVSDITVMSPSDKFRDDLLLLTLGLIKQSEGASVKLFLIVKGPYREETEITLDTIDPESVMQVTLGEKKITDSIHMIPLTIKIPPGSQTVNRLGTDQGKTARIVLKTTHPHAKEVVIYLQFAIEA